MNNKHYFLILVFVVGVIILSTTIYFLNQKKLSTPATKKVEPVISNVLFFTYPVTDFVGKVDKISGNSIWISGKYTIFTPPTPAFIPTAVPGQVITVPPLPPVKVFTYKVNIIPQTVISRPETLINFLIKNITPFPTPKFSVKDIKAGQMVSVTTASDLRTLKNEEFDALTVKLPVINNTLVGKIADINVKDGIIILKAIPPFLPNEHLPTPEKPKETEVEYAISVNSDTEISRMGQAETSKTGATPKPPQPIKYQITDLKKDIQITIYTDSDVIEIQKLKAFRIEPPADLIPAVSLSPAIRPTVSPKT